jgi:hypothetical protein
MEKKRRLLIMEIESVTTGQHHNDSTGITTSSNIGSNKLEIAKYSESELFKITDRGQLKAELLARLVRRKLFWSYKDESVLKNAPDPLIIETVMKYGDLTELTALTYIYPMEKLKELWRIYFGKEEIYKKEGKLVSAFLFDSQP